MSSSHSRCPVSGPSESSAPLRVDLAGGWTDVPPYPIDFGGEVVNFAINRRVRVRKREGVEDSDLEFDFRYPISCYPDIHSHTSISSIHILDRDVPRLPWTDPREVVATYRGI